jgi:large subunit ribosomal protein L23
MSLYEVIKKPVITEKSLAESKRGKYTFEVRKDASKGPIKKAVAKLFGVDVLSVKTANYRGRPVRRGPRRLAAKKSDWKKAVVTVKEGQKIDLFDLEGQKE